MDFFEISFVTFKIEHSKLGVSKVTKLKKNRFFHKPCYFLTEKKVAKI